MTEAYPLKWPDGWPRTKSPQRSKFDTSDEAAKQGILREIRLMGGGYPVISTNIELRRDGLPYSNRAQPADTGVAVYFQLRKKPMAFACDRWDRVRDNMRAIEKTIENLRGIERWGASDMMERAFSAFEMLPAPDWRLDLMFPPGAKPSLEEIEARYRELAKRYHPDAGGDAEKFNAITAAREAARRDRAA